MHYAFISFSHYKYESGLYICLITPFNFDVSLKDNNKSFTQKPRRNLLVYLSIIVLTYI